MTLADRVLQYLAAHPGSSCEDVARGVHARTVRVREELRNRARYSETRSYENGRKCVLYSVAPGYGWDGLGRAEKQPSQCARILALLDDGCWHTHHELYAIGCVAHSRIAELRRRGYEFDKRRITTGGEQIWEYRLAREAKAA